MWEQTNEEVFVVAKQSRLKPGGSAFTPNIVFGTDRRIIIKDPTMFGLRENVVDIPYDMISSVRLDKGVFSSNVIFKAPGLINSGRMGKLDKMMEGHRDNSGLADEEGIITAIPKNKAEDLLEVIRNGLDRDREVHRHSPEQPQTSSVSIADELMKLASLSNATVYLIDMIYMMLFHGSVVKRLELYYMYPYFLVDCQFLVLLYQALKKLVLSVWVSYTSYPSYCDFSNTISIRKCWNYIF
jgi:hypothetical protein